jgi:hypothetical protein
VCGGAANEGERARRRAAARARASLSSPAWSPEELKATEPWGNLLAASRRARKAMRMWPLPPAGGGEVRIGASSISAAAGRAGAHARAASPSSVGRRPASSTDRTSIRRQLSQ